MKPAALLLVALLCAACGDSPFAPSGAGDAFTYPPMLAPVMAAMDQDSWIHPLLSEPLGVYVRRTLAGIVLDDTLPPQMSGMFHPETHLLHWQPRNTPQTSDLAVLIGVILHEARHGQGVRHTCPTDAQGLQADRTMEEGGAYAVQILYLEHMGSVARAAELRRDYIGCS